MPFAGTPVVGLQWSRSVLQLPIVAACPGGLRGLAVARDPQQTTIGGSMAIVDDFVVGIRKKTLEHAGARQNPTSLVIHYSVTYTVAQAVRVLNQRRLSYHVLIEKDGTAFQTRPFTETALHPGLSNWKAMSGL